MRILVVHEAAVGGGGVESYLADLIPALASRGHDVAFLHHDSRGRKGPTSIAPAGILTACVEDEGLEAAISKIARWKPDVCFSHNMRPLEVDEQLLLRWPVVKMMHGYLGTCVSGEKAHAFPGVTPCTRTFGPACAALYFPRHCGQLRPVPMIRNYAWASRQSGLFGRYAHIVVASAHMAAEYARHGVDAARLTRAPLFPTLPAGGTARPVPAVPTILFAGRMTALKGGATLIHAVAAADRMLPSPLHLVLAGDGPQRRRWEALARRLGVNASFRGWLTADERLAAFRAATIVAVPSLWPEPFGLVGLEAAAHGVPGVAFDVGGVKEWLHDGISGRIVPEHGNADAFGRALAAIISAPEELRRLGDGALRVAAALNVDAHVDSIERLLGEAAARVALA